MSDIKFTDAIFIDVLFKMNTDFKILEMMETSQKEKSKTHIKEKIVYFTSSIGRLNQWSHFFEKRRVNLCRGNVK